MKTKIGTSFGLAMLMAIGIIATMLAFGFFSPNKASAATDVEDITISTTTAAANVQVTIKFTHDNTLTAGSGQIFVRFDKGWGIPSTLAKEHITLTTSQTTGGTSNPSIDPTVAAAANYTTVTITIGDTDPAAANTQSMQPPVSGTSATTDHTLVFSPLAALTNPTSAGDIGSTSGGAVGHWICMWTTEDTTPSDGTCPTTSTYTPTYDSAASIPRKVSLSATSGGNGTSVTATGKGYVSGTLTAFLDDGADGAFDSGTDTVLGTSDAAVSGGTATVTFSASVPTFSATSTNTINLMDGLGSTASTANDATFDITGSVTTSKTSVKRGESVTVKLAQYATGDVLSIKIGGAMATLPASVTVGSTGALNLAVTVPTTTSLGTQRVAIAHASEAARNVNIEVVGAPLTLSPSTAVPLQTITVSGSGFTSASTVSTIKIGNFSVPAANIASDATVTADDSGNIVAQVKIPIDATDSTTRTAGTYTMTVTDSSGRTGQADIVIPSRSVTLSPSSSRRASTVTINGTGFPAATSVTIVYGSTTVGSATPDSAGAFSATVTVPTTASIPSSNTVTVTSSGSGSPAGTAAHAVPGASIVVAESSTVSGQIINVTGEGFPGYATVTALSVGAVSAIPTPAPSTDIEGKFTTTVLVPQLATGTQAVLATVGGISANSSVTVTTAVAVPVVTTTATAEVFADVISNDDNLVRVWRFDNATQAWSFFDPRDAFADANTLTEASSGNIVWVNVTADQAFQSTTLFAGWNLISLD